MTHADNVRTQVSVAYTDAIVRSTGCCGPADKEPGCATAKLAGYTPEQLQDLPAAAVGSSFGCGNPVALSGIGAGETVLDLGSGAGLDLLLAAEKVGPTGRVVGVDMTDAMIARARENTADVPNIEIIKGTIEALPLPDASVDHVISNCVINLSPEKERVFAEISRVLRPGGKISISDVVVSDLPDWIRQVPGVYESCIGGAVSEAEYLFGIRAAGLTDVQVVDRLVYDAEQIGGMVASELGCCVPEELIAQGAQAVAGKVQSVRVVGRKADS